MFGELGKMMKVARDVKQRMPAMQAELAARQFTAAAGDGAVSVTVTGKGVLADVRIDPAIMSDGDGDPAAGAARLGDWITAAVSDAQNQATRAAAEMMNELTGGMNLPGLDQLL